MVSEPPEEDQEGDCEDVGVAFVSIRDILKNRRDILDQDIQSKFYKILFDFGEKKHNMSWIKILKVSYTQPKYCGKKWRDVL